MRNITLVAAQSSSRRGDVAANVACHVRLVDRAALLGADLVVFPELSLTGYELDLGTSLQLESTDRALEPLAAAAARHGVHVLVGAPWSSGERKPYLGAFVFSPGRVACYAKVHVHESERPYFASGEDACIVPVDGAPTAIAICADTSHPEHAAAAAALGAEVYVASVMKTPAEYPGHADRLAGYARRHGMATLTANYAGATGGAESAGRSAVWDERGVLVASAPAAGAALVVARRTGGTWSGEVVTDPMGSAV